MFSLIPLDVIKAHIIPYLSPLEIESLRNISKRYQTRIESKLEKWKHYDVWRGVHQASMEGYIDMVTLFLSKGAYL